MVAGDPQAAAVQGTDRSANRSGAHHHYRGRPLPVPPHLSAAQGGQIMRKGQGTGAEVLNPGESGIGGSNPGERAMGGAPPRCTRLLADPQSRLLTNRPPYA